MSHYHNKQMKQTVFNNLHESTVNPIKTFYAFLHYDGADHPVFFEGKFRIEAIRYFKEQAQLFGGKFKQLYTLNN